MDSGWQNRLAATMRASNPGTPSAFVLTVLVRGISLNAPPARLRDWCTKNGPADVQTLITDDSAWNGLVAAARRHRAATSSPERAISTARLVVARVLGPADGRTARAEVRDRAALAVIGLGQMDRGWPSTVVSQPWLAVQLGVTLGGARIALRSLEERGWLRVIRRPTGKPAVVKLARLHDQESRSVAASAYDLVGALATGDESVPGVSELMSVAHPAWSYAPATAVPRLAHRHWLTAMVDAVGVPGVTAGQADRGLAQSRSVLRQAGVWTDGRIDTTALDNYAESSGAAAAHQAAEADRRAAAEQRTADVESARERRRQAVRLLIRLGRPPVWEAPERDRVAWLQGTRPALAGIPAESTAAVRVELTRALKRAGWEAEPSRAASHWLLAS